MKLSEALKDIVNNHPEILTDRLYLKAYLTDYCNRDLFDQLSAKVFLTLQSKYSIYEDIKNNGLNNYDVFKSKINEFNNIDEFTYLSILNEIYIGFGEHPSPVVKPAPQNQNNVKNPNKKKVVHKNKQKVALKVIGRNEKIYSFIIWAASILLLVLFSELGIFNWMSKLEFKSNLNVGLSILSFIGLVILFLGLGFLDFAMTDDYFTYTKNSGLYEKEFFFQPFLFNIYFCLRFLIFACLKKDSLGMYATPIILITVFLSIISISLSVGEFYFGVKYKYNKYIYYLMNSGHSYFAFLILIGLYCFSALVPFWVILTTTIITILGYLIIDLSCLRDWFL